jgi:hypothetical protein
VQLGEGTDADGLAEVDVAGDGGWESQRGQGDMNVMKASGEAVAGAEKGHEAEANSGFWSLKPKSHPRS